MTKEKARKHLKNRFDHLAVLYVGLVFCQKDALLYASEIGKLKEQIREVKEKISALQKLAY